MKNLSRILSLLLLTVLFTARGFSQNISMPYSIIGIGDIENSYFNRNSGMANTGYAMRSGRNLYQANPASYSAMDNQFFTFELGAQGKTVTYQGTDVDPNENSNGDFAIKRLAAGFKLSNRWGSSVILSPYSNVSYLVVSNKNIIGGGGTTSVIDGNGGVNQILIGNSYQFSKNLSVGINTAYLFGSVKQTENILDASSQSTIATTLNTYYQKFNFTYGLQYMAKLNSKLNYNLGLVYSPQNKLKGETSKTAISNGTEIVRDEIIDPRNFTLPATYGIGMSLTRNRSLTFAADFKYQDWDAVKYKRENASLVSSQRYSAGVDYNKLRAEKDALYEVFNLQAGVFYNNSQIRINGEQLSEYGFTVGAGKPVGRGRINLNTALEVGTRGTTKQNLIKENYVQLTLVISYRDFWFTKGRKYD